MTSETIILMGGPEDGKQVTLRMAGQLTHYRIPTPPINAGRVAPENADLSVRTGFGLYKRRRSGHEIFDWQGWVS
jgi:hypothetical protein